MNFLLMLHDRIFGELSSLLAPWFITTAARFSVTSVLLLIF